MKNIMRNMLAVIVLGLLTFVSIAAQTDHARPVSANTTRSVTDVEVISQLEAYVDKLVAEDKFSGTILIAKNGTPIFKKAYGLASKGYNVPNRTDTKFNLGSMNKMFTSVAIAQLAEAGKLSYNDPISKYLPDYPNKAVSEKVTIHQLLTHTSGVGDYFNDKFMEASKTRFVEIKDYFPLFVDNPLLFEPGTKWRYSNAGFIVLGAIVEKVSGQNYFDYVREHIYKPAGMINTDAYEMDRDTPNMATGYTKRDPKTGADFADGQRRTNLFLHSYRGGPAGGGFSTVEDLLSFANALASHKLLDQKYTDLITTGKVDAPGRDGKYAYGFEDERINGQRRVGHGGGFMGINAQLHIYPDLGYTVAVMSNYDPPAAGQVADRIGKLLTETNIPAAIKLAPALLQSYAGKYEGDAPAGANGAGPERLVVTLTVEKGGLLITLGRGQHQFQPLSETEFFDEDSEDVRMTFNKDAKGNVVSLKLINAGPAPLIAIKK
jgi:CubicO group peptidase (beta-lactamase class C family)